MCAWGKGPTPQSLRLLEDALAVTVRGRIEVVVEDEMAISTVAWEAWGRGIGGSAEGHLAGFCHNIL